VLQFGKYLLENQRPEWATQYVDYKGLKDLIKQATEEARKVRDPVAPRAKPCCA
jgi:SPX domain protein involved in polyphosphate accumulation